jgi:hypothetical protein
MEMSRPVTVTISHDLGKDEAKRRIAEGFSKLHKGLTGGMLFKFSEEWSAPDQMSFTARGFGQNIVGKIDVFPQHVRIEAMLPGLLATIAETVAGQVEKEGRLLLEKKS